MKTKRHFEMDMKTLSVNLLYAHTLRDFFWYLTAFLVSSLARQMYSAALETFFSMLLTMSPCK